MPVPSTAPLFLCVKKALLKVLLRAWWWQRLRIASLGGGKNGGTGMRSPCGMSAQPAGRTEVPAEVGQEDGVAASREFG